MTAFHGKDGVVKVGANAVAEIQKWNVTATNDVVEDTAMGDQDKTFLPGVNSWSGSLDCSYDPTDATGQNALSIGAVVTLNLYPQGSVTTKKYKTGAAIVSSIPIEVNRNGIISRSFNFTGSGPLTEATVP